MKTARLITFLLLLYCLPVAAQVNRPLYDEVKDSVVAKFNRNNYPDIYSLLDTSFSKNISETQLVRFLKGIQNSGKILGSAFQSEEKGVASYLLNFELRDMVMHLQVKPDKKITTLGFLNVPPVLLDRVPKVLTDNPLKSALDKAVDSIALDYFRNAKANSLSIGILQNGKPYIYNYGETDMGNGKLPSAQTGYEIGSITKTFTATILGQAVSDNKVSLRDDIRKYLPGNYPNLSFNGVPITLENLANHTSGLPELPADIGDLVDYDPVNPELHYDSARFYTALSKMTIDTIPGHKFRYSNWGMSVLGHILEKVYGKPIAVLIRQYITSPLHMNNTWYVSEKPYPNIAVPHSENDRILPITDEHYFSPAGGLCTTVNDLLIYMNAQITENRAAIKLTHQPTVNDMGLGWGVRKSGTSREFQHNGSTQGSTAHISIFTELNSGCVVLSNNKVQLGKTIVAIQKILKQKAS
jgi:CubicO group peptidase (beta-lactamase class C family)